MIAPYSRLLLTAACWLVTTHPCPAPVTVLPEATPKPAAKPKLTEKKPAPQSAQKAASLVGTWQGSCVSQGSTRFPSGFFRSTVSGTATYTVHANGTITYRYGDFTLRWLEVPPGVPRQTTTKGTSFGPFSTERRGASLAWTDAQQVQHTLTAAADGRSASCRSRFATSNGSTSTGTATLTRVR